MVPDMRAIQRDEFVRPHPVAIVTDVADIG